MKKIPPFILILSVLFIIPTMRAARPAIHRSFYVWTGDENTESVYRHAAQMETICPFFYHVDSHSLLQGNPDSRLLSFAKTNRLKVVPVVWNDNFQESSATGLFSDPAMGDRFIDALSRECASKAYDGVQIDFENIPGRYRDAYSLFIAKLAESLHRGNVRLSVAVVPVERPLASPSNEYRLWLFEHWQAVYDLGRLSHSADEIVVMAYDQHTRLTPPGPISGDPWFQSVLKKALTQVPPEKLIVGIPLYGRQWIAQPPQGADGPRPWPLLSYRDATDIACRSKVVPQWDKSEKAPWFEIEEGGLREYVFFMDAAAVRARERTAAGLGLNHVAWFVLGKEDPTVWRSVRGISSREKGLN